MLIVAVCFLLTGVLVHWKPETTIARKPESLDRAFSKIEGWQNLGMAPIEESIVQSLMLDDYLNNRFRKNGSDVMLYIGYYLASKNVGAAHSPLVCFPGQGWQLADFAERSVDIGDHRIHLMTMTATSPLQKILLMYWFQAFEETSPETFLQKINLIRAKWLKGREDNAFVRLTMSLDSQSPEQAYATGISFIQSFYPVLLSHIKSNQP